MLGCAFCDALDYFGIHDVLHVFINGSNIPYDACAYWWRGQSHLMQHEVTACSPNGFGGYIIYIERP